MIAYVRCSLNEHEKNYRATRLEMLALVTYMDHFSYFFLGRKFRLRTDHHSLVWLMSFKEPQGQVARWLGRLQYDSEIQRHPGRLHNNADALSRRPRRQHGNCPSCTPTGLSQVTVVTRDLPASETPSEVRNCWSPKVVAQAQRDDPDISVVLSHLLKEWRKPAVEELRSMSYAALAVWAQFELLLLQQGVLYIKSAGHTTQAKLRMVLPKQLVEKALVEGHDGVAGAHLRRMKTLMKMKN